MTFDPSSQPSTAPDWLTLFETFISHIRIPSKESVSIDPKVPGVPLELWGSQRLYMRELADGLSHGIRTFFFLKNRQAGISTISLALDLWWLAWFPGTQGVLVTDTEGNRNKFRLLLQLYLNSFPKNFFGSAFQIVKGRNNRDFIHFTNGSTLDFLVAGMARGANRKRTLGESRGYNFAHLTEVANYGSPEGLQAFRETLAEHHPNRLFLYESPLALDTPLPTPFGWTTMGKVKEGDYLLNEKGEPCRVLGTSPVFINRRCYQVNFKNGDSIVADADHKWRVWERRWPTNPQWKERDLSTKELDPDRHFISFPKALNLSPATLLIDPYFLGVWLGDGDTNATRITAGDEDIADMRELLRERGLTLGKTTYSAGRAGAFCVHNVIADFRALNLIGNKHIPREYLRASEDQRRLLLAGLMDTDGSVHKENFACCFCSTNERLLDDVAELLASLGIRYTKSILSEEGKLRVFPGGYLRSCSKSWRLLFSEDREALVFKLPRKRAIHETPRRQVQRKTKQIGISSVVEVPSVPVRCVAVDTPSHLFLAGRTMLPTHNTAKGFNAWHAMYEEGLRDKLSKRSVFIGWWAKEINSLRQKGPDPQPRLYHTYAAQPISPDEREKMRLVLERHGHVVTLEQLAWYRWREADTSSSLEDLHQNQPWYAEEAFVLTGSSFFQVRVIQKRREFLFQNPDVEAYAGYKFHLANNFLHCKMEQVIRDKTQVQLRIWEEPSRLGTYVIGVDPAWGRNEPRDRHAISIFRCYADALVQAAEWTSNAVDTRQAAWVLAYLAGAYRDCVLNIEISGGAGLAILSEFKSLRAQLQMNAFPETQRESQWEDFLAQARWYIYRRYDTQSGSSNLTQWSTTRQNKFEIMNQFRDTFVKNELHLFSIPLLDEMTYVVHCDGTIEAQGRNKDDRVMATALAVRAWIDAVRPGMMARNATYAAVSLAETQEGPSSLEGMGNRMVQDFFKRADERAAEGPQPPAWMRKRGLA